MLPGSFTRQQVAQRYAEKSGQSLAQVVFYYCFGLFKTAVVAQQIYYRYQQGLTKDERFAHFHQAARLMASQAAQCLQRGTL